MALDSSPELNQNLLQTGLEKTLEGYGGLLSSPGPVKGIYRLARQSVGDFMNNLPKGFLPYGNYRVIGRGGQNFCQISSQIDGAGSSIIRVEGPFPLKYN